MAQHQVLRDAWQETRGIGTVLALLDATEEVCMFALSAILVGVIGVIYVRRRSSRKKQTV